MSKPNKKTLTKYYDAIKKSKLKYITSETLSEIVGIYPDILNECFSYFDPMVNLDTEFNLVDLLPSIKEYINLKPVKKTKKTAAKKKVEKLPYKNINEFVKEKMTFGGMFNYGSELSDDDLLLLKKLIIQEQNKRKQK
jgi:hypothetical protein